MCRYVSIEDVHKILESKYIEWYGTICNEINSLTTINPESMIIAEIEKRKNYSYTADRWWDRARFVVEIEINILEEFLQRFKS